MLTHSLPPILESSEAIELWSLASACIAAKGGRRGERWEESFCCYVLWESPVWRIYGLADSESWHGNVVCRSATVKQLRQPPKLTGGIVLSCKVCCKSLHITRMQKKNLVSYLPQSVHPVVVLVLRQACAFFICDHVALAHLQSPAQQLMRWTGPVSIKIYQNKKPSYRRNVT